MQVIARLLWLWAATVLALVMEDSYIKPWWRLPDWQTDLDSMLQDEDPHIQDQDQNQ